MGRSRFAKACEFAAGRREWSPDEEKFRQRVEDAYPILRRTAVNGDTITYTELADSIETNRRMYLSCILDAISYLEALDGNPPLTAVVVRSTTGYPSEGMVELVEELELPYDADNLDSEEMTEEMIRDVHDYWRQNPVE